MSVFIVSTALIIFLALVQVSFVTLPFGVVLIILWYYTHQSKNIAWFVVIFSVVLAVSANLPIWAMMASTTISLYVIILGRTFLPSRAVVNLFLIGVSLVSWEISVVLLSKLSL